MKKTFPLLIALVFMLLSHAHGQDAIVTIPDVTRPAGNIQVPIQVDFTLEDVCSFQFYIHFDDDLLTFKGIDNLQLIGIMASPADTPSPVLITWFSASMQPADFAGKLLDISFLYAGGEETQIEFVLDEPTDSAVADCIAVEDYQNVVFNNGTITPSPFVPISGWAIWLGFGLIIAFIIIKRSRLV